MTVSEKVAYLKGLADGLGIKDSTSEGKLMLAVIDVLESMAEDIEAVDAHAKDLSDSISDINEDMEYLEDLCIGESDDCDCGFSGGEYEDEEDDGELPPCSGCCSSCGDVQEYEVTCPKCGETITVFEEDLDFGSIRCPKCDAELEFDNGPDDEKK